MFEMDRRRSEHRGACGPFGRELRKWRGIRAMSQLDLAAAVGTSARHLGFVETGCSKPGRDLVLHLAEALNIPLRLRNELLAAAGFAAVFQESSLTAPAMEGMRTALAFVLRQQEPYPAIVVRPDWTVIMANEAAVRWRRLFISDAEKDQVGANAANAMKKIFFDPQRSAELFQHADHLRHAARPTAGRASDQAVFPGRGGVGGTVSASRASGGRRLAKSRLTLS
jgi:transcriptional regulator with XRE-family HTH domain